MISVDNFQNSSHLHSLILEDLFNIGIKVPKFKAFRTKPNDILYIEEKIPLFGSRLELLPSVKLRNNNVVPKFAVECFEWMKNSFKTEGIFRKAGSFLKQKEISHRLDQSHTTRCLEDIISCHPIPLHAVDVACLFKQWLRELPEPLLTIALQGQFIVSLSLPSEELILKSLLNLCLLLPLSHQHLLKFTLKQLHAVSLLERHNLMSISALSICVAPCFFRMAESSTSAQSSNMASMQAKVLMILMQNHNLIAMVPSELVMKVLGGSDVENKDGGRTSREKKKRSRSLQNFVRGISANFNKLRSGWGAEKSAERTLQPREKVDRGKDVPKTDRRNHVGDWLKVDGGVEGERHEDKRGDARMNGRFENSPESPPNNNIDGGRSRSHVRRSLNLIVNRTINKYKDTKEGLTDKQQNNSNNVTKSPLAANPTTPLNTKPPPTPHPDRVHHRSTNVLDIDSKSNNLSTASLGRIKVAKEKRRSLSLKLGETYTLDHVRGTRCIAVNSSESLRRSDAGSTDQLVRSKDANDAEKYKMKWFQRRSNSVASIRSSVFDVSYQDNPLKSTNNNNAAQNVMIQSPSRFSLYAHQTPLQHRPTVRPSYISPLLPNRDISRLRKCTKQQKVVCIRAQHTAK